MKRLHVHVGVEDLARSIGFYSTLFGAEPTVTKDDYAKWMLDDPRVNFAISSGNAHKGIEQLFARTPLLEGHRLAARVSGDSCVAYSWAYCQALEGLAACTVPATSAGSVASSRR